MADNDDALARPILGTRIDPVTREPIRVLDEREHFMRCGRCGQMFDMRDLGQVFHHEEVGHEPLPTN